MTRRTRYLSALALAGAMAWLAGCQSQLQEELATTHLSVVSVAPWEEMKTALEPKFKPLTGDAALDAVMPITQLSADQTLSMLRVEGKVAAGLGGNEAPNTAALPSMPARLLTPEARETVLQEGQDPVLARQLAASLVQEVAMINAAVKYAPLREGYQAYVVRLQVSVMPSRRDVDKDIYADISFFTDQAVAWPELLGHPNSTVAKAKLAKDDKVPRVPVVIPMLARDNMEKAVRSQSAQQLRSLALSLALAGPSAGGSAGLLSHLERLSDQYGQDLNSLFTVARLNDSTVRVRLGANHRTPQGAWEAGCSYALVPRNHTVTLLVLVPNAAADGTAESLYALMRTKMRDVTRGDELRVQTAADLAEGLGEIVDDYLRGTSGWVVSHQIETLFRQEFNKCPAQMFDVLMAILLDHYPRFKSKLTDVLDGPGRAMLEDMLFWHVTLDKAEARTKAGPLINRLKASIPLLWMELSAKVCAGRFSITRIDLPVRAPAIWRDQAALTVDDGKKVTVTLQGGRDLSMRTVVAYVRVKPKGGRKEAGKKRLLAHSIQTRLDGTVEIALLSPGMLAVEFDANSRLELQTKDGKAIELRRPARKGLPASKPVKPADPSVATFPMLYKSPKKATKATPPFEISTDPAGSVQAVGGVAKVALHVKLAKGVKGPVMFALKIDGGILGSQPQPGTTTGTFSYRLDTKKRSIFTFVKDGSVDLELTKVSSANLVVLTATPMQPKGEAPEAVRLRVE